ncbi:hypothetical protein [Myxococcus landrumensis]|uniref:Lipoprotein n=1 Tax=Myxococcus landrumensis TaxID=2813577 RepID=A0ABX7N8R8_9BACT|nr:hypothetical protein [Myxococcus landrumus]QSQ14784.1 hypothetical protein JY572_01455 [Myxococcus landrumus]
MGRDREVVTGGAALTLLSVLGLVGAAVFAQRQRHTMPAKQRAHDALLKHLTTCWARVRECAIVGSEHSSEDALTHYILSMELEPWCDESAPAEGHAPSASRCWQVRWRIEAALATSVVPGTWIAVAYDRRSPNNSDTQLMQYLVSPSGAALPLR